MRLSVDSTQLAPQLGLTQTLASVRSWPKVDVLGGRRRRPLVVSASTAVSTGQCNSLLISLNRCLEVGGLAWRLVSCLDAAPAYEPWGGVPGPRPCPSPHPQHSCCISSAIRVIHRRLLWLGRKRVASPPRGCQLAAAITSTWSPA